MLRPYDDLIAPFLEALSDRHGEAMDAVLFYGSALRDPGDASRMLDFYVLYTAGKAFHGKRWLHLANLLLPPNVFYLEVETESGTRRAKYATLTTRQFLNGVKPQAFLSSIWGRFSQPYVVAWATDVNLAKTLEDVRATAAATLLTKATPLAPTTCTAEGLWVHAFKMSYGAELRSEREGRALQLFSFDPETYRAYVEHVLPSIDYIKRASDGQLHIEAGSLQKIWWRMVWMVRAFCGKIVSILRLIKAAFTFEGGQDYLLWKISGHSGVHLEPTPWQRRHPLLAAPKMAWQLYRKGAFR